MEEMMTMKDVHLSEVCLLEWEQMLEIMEFYNRNEGYVDKINGKLEFFDEDPHINGVGALKVTKDEVKQHIKDFRG